MKNLKLRGSFLFTQCNLVVAGLVPGCCWGARPKLNLISTANETGACSPQVCFDHLAPYTKIRVFVLFYKKMMMRAAVFARHYCNII